MTALGAEPAIAVPEPRPGVAGGVRSRLAAVCVAHAIVDLFSALVVPILSVLEGRLHLDARQGALLVGAGSLCSGAIQPLVAWLSDRYDTRALGTIGFALAVVAVGCVGFARDFTDLLLLQLIGTAGIGAFHPVSAAAVGQLSGRRRSTGVAAFFTAGMAGGIAGFWGAPGFVSRFGVPAYAWLIPGGLLAVLLLAWSIHGVPHRQAGAHDHHRALSDVARRRHWRAVGVLYAGNALRFTANMALVYLVVRWAEELVLARSGAPILDAGLRAQASRINGPMQAAMAIGMGISGLAAGFVRVRHEKALLVLVPVLGAAATALFPHAGSAGAFILAALAGVGYAGVIPITISLAQRLLPHRTGLASGLMMGGAWALAAVGPPLAEALAAHAGLAGAFHGVAALLLLAGGLGLALPGSLLHEAHERA